MAAFRFGRLGALPGSQILINLLLQYLATRPIRCSKLNNRRFNIGGHWDDPVHGTDCEIIDPSTEEPVAIISPGGQADTNAAVAAAPTSAPWSASCTTRKCRI